jgi:HSP90 family molecular chaperone
LDREGILHLLRGSQLYPGPSAVLYELVLNAVDSTRQAASLVGGCRPITVTLNSQTRELSVNDYGVGMNEADVRQLAVYFAFSMQNTEVDLVV